MLAPSYESLLDEIATLWATTRKGFRDGMLRIGKLIYEYLRAKLSEGDGLNERERVEKGIARRSVIKQIASRLQVSGSKIQELIRSAMVVNLLCDGNVGNLSYASIRALRLLIHRPNKGLQLRRCKKYKSDNEIEPSSIEVWAIRRGIEDASRKMVQIAVSEGWREKDIRENIQRLLLNSPSHYVTKKDKPEPESPTVSSHTFYVRSNSENITLTKDPDNDEYIIDKMVSVLLASNDPDKVLREVTQKLENIRSIPPSMLSSREDRLRQYEQAASLKQPLPFSQEV